MEVCYTYNVMIMKKKDGFTLIELIAVIAIMAALSVVVGLNINKMMKNQNESDIKNYKETVQNAACVYAENNGIFSNPNNPPITPRFLVDNGLLSKNLKNPETNKTAFEDYTIIKVTFKDNQRICTYGN